MGNRLPVFWTKLASDELKNIVEYWNLRNRSTTYSNKLLKNLTLTTEILSLHPYIGKVSPQRENIRIKVFMKNFLIIYKIEESRLIILDFWDTRKDPSKNKYL